MHILCILGLACSYPIRAGWNFMHGGFLYWLVVHGEQWLTCGFFLSFCTAADEVDIMGYNSNQSDTDDHSSIQSMTSDGGMAISTKRLCLEEGHAI